MLTGTLFTLAWHLTQLWAPTSEVNRAHHWYLLVSGKSWATGYSSVESCMFSKPSEGKTFCFTVLFPDFVSRSQTVKGNFLGLVKKHKICWRFRLEKKEFPFKVKFIPKSTEECPIMLFTYLVFKYIFVKMLILDRKPLVKCPLQVPKSGITTVSPNISDVSLDFWQQRSASIKNKLSVRHTSVASSI